MLGDTRQLLGKLAGTGLAGGLAGGALTGLLASKKGRKFASSALTVGGLALVGGIAYKAYQHYRQGRTAASSDHTPQPDRTGSTPPYGTAFLPAQSDVDAQGALSLLLMRAMIAAAKADGELDSEEGGRIFGQVNRLNLDAEHKALLLEEYSKPLDLDALVALVDSPELAAEVYAASLLAIDRDTAVERRYLAELAWRLHLDPGLVNALHAEAAHGGEGQGKVQPLAFGNS